MFEKPGVDCFYHLYMYLYQRYKCKSALLFATVVALEVGSLSDTSQIVGRILQVVSPQEKTIVYLRSIKDTPVVMDPSKYCRTRPHLTENTNVYKTVQKQLKLSSMPSRNVTTMSE